jgi:hypothetical protein
MVPAISRQPGVSEWKHIDFEVDVDIGAVDGGPCPRQARTTLSAIAVGSSCRTGA